MKNTHLFASTTEKENFLGDIDMLPSNKPPAMGKACNRAKISYFVIRAWRI
jgi:hypothetical protein